MKKKRKNHKKNHKKSHKKNYKKFTLWKSSRERLIQAAKHAQKTAYCPYSRYPVGAAVLTSSGRIFAGCNVENASFGLSICAERSAVFSAVSHGAKSIRAVAVVARSARPCGACRQVLIEFADKNAEMIMVNFDPARKRQKITTMRIKKCLPSAFNPAEAGL